MAEMFERLMEARIKAGYKTAAQACSAFGWIKSTYYGHENGRVKISRDKAKLYAKAFGIDPSWLMYGTSTAFKTLRHAGSVLVGPTKGTSCAGRWLEFDDQDEISRPPFHIINGQFPAEEQFIFKVSGSSIEKLRIYDGDYIACVRYFFARKDLQSGDLVVVERRRGSLFERSVREIYCEQTHVELKLHSDNNRLQSIIRVPKSKELIEEDGTSINLVGLVLASFRPR